MESGWTITVTRRNFSAGRVTKEVYVSATEDPKRATAAVRRYTGYTGSAEIEVSTGEGLLELQNMKRGEVRKLTKDSTKKRRGRTLGTA